MVQIFETYCTYLPTCCLNGERSPSVGLTLVQPRKWSVDSEDRSRTHAKLVERAKMPAFHKPYSMSKTKTSRRFYQNLTSGMKDHFI